MSTHNEQLFVPLTLSLSDDAPGYNTTLDNEEENLGPLCWKCDGTGLQKRRGPKPPKNQSSSSNNNSNSVIEEQENSLPPCKVCKGMKRLKIKKQLLEARNRKGEITQVSVPSDWHINMTEDGLNASYDNVQHLQEVLTVDELQPKEGEQLCGLVGGWRIFQRKAGHRWTTDDIVTAWAACTAVKTILPVLRSLDEPSSHLSNISSNWEDLIENYLDIGCGNGSVLLMVARNMPPTTKCIGVEARSEAVSLSRRSIAFNCGLDCTRIQVRNRDFREINTNTLNVIPEGAGTFDLVTGTPPYFKVNFKHNSDQVTQALIRQGGFPSNKDSAPARCEFRGGIEAYCHAASVAMKPNGVFVVCENWLNHDRVILAAQDANLFIYSINKVVGKEGKEVLFCVYTMIKTPPTTLKSNHTTLFKQNDSPPFTSIGQFIVRDGDGAWTREYSQLLRDVLYPVASLHPSKKY